MAFPTTGLLARYEALSETGKSDGDPLATITDQSGAARNLSQGTAAKQPVWKAAIVNAQPVYRLDGVDDAANRSDSLSPTALTLTAVVSSGTAEATTRQWVFGMNSGTSRIAALTEGDTASGEFGHFFRTSTATVQQATTGVDTTAWCVLTLTWDGATVTLYRNGTQVASDALAGAQGSNEISMGTLFTLGQFFGGDLALAGLWNTALDATGRADLHTYVQDTYGITVSDYSGGAATDLLIDDATHGHTADNLTVAQVHALAIADALHTHTADTLALLQVHALTVDDALHSHTADTLTLTTADTLTIADAGHTHTADAPTLTQVHRLTVADSLHAHTADTVTLVETGPQTPINATDWTVRTLL